MRKKIDIENITEIVLQLNEIGQYVQVNKTESNCFPFVSDKENKRKVHVYPLYFAQ